jgi:hypothetical protein
MNHRPLPESILQREARMEGTQNDEPYRSPRALSSSHRRVARPGENRIR